MYLNVLVLVCVNDEWVQHMLLSWDVSAFVKHTGHVYSAPCQVIYLTTVWMFQLQTHWLQKASLHAPQ